MSSTPTVTSALDALHGAKERLPLVLRQLMAYTGIRTKHLADALDVSPPAISARLTGSTVIKQEEVAALAWLFDMPEGVLYRTPDEALRWLIDHPSEERAERLADLRKRKMTCSSAVAA